MTYQGLSFKKLLKKIKAWVLQFHSAAAWMTVKSKGVLNWDRAAGTVKVQYS